MQFDGSFAPVQDVPGSISLSRLRAQKKTFYENADASLVDLGTVSRASSSTAR